MIIIASKPGKLGNLLIVYATFMAWGKAHRRRIVNPAFHAYARYFSGSLTRGSAGRFRLVYLCARLIIRSGISNRLFSTVHLDWHERIDLEDPPPQITGSRICFVQGWQFRCNTLIQKYAAQLRTAFTPATEYREQLDRFFAAHIAPGCLVIGIHIRHGDYRTFENGRYFYSLAQYGQIMQNILHLLGSEKVVFMVSSNAPVNLEALKRPGLTLVSAPGHELLDMYALSRCSYIAGPPSTYSMWASFYGEVPLYMIREPERQFTLREFAIQDSF